MPKCTVETVLMGRVGRRRIEASLMGGDLVSDGGVLLLRQMDRRLGLTACAAAALSYQRRGSSVRHRVHMMLSQRVYGLCCGWEDLNDYTARSHGATPRLGDASGPSTQQLTLTQQGQDHIVRQTISRELGHERLQITTVYMSR